MVAQIRNFTPAEAATISGIAVKAVHNAIDKDIVNSIETPGRGRLLKRRLTGEALLELKLWYGVGASLSATRRQRLFDEIKAKPLAKTVKADDLLIVDVEDVEMISKIVVSTLIFSLFWNEAAFAKLTNAHPDHCTESIVITDVSDKPTVLSGVITTWIRIDGTNAQGRESTYYLPYLEEANEPPQKAHHCDIDYHIGTVSGAVGTASLAKPILSAKIVDGMACSG